MKVAPKAPVEGWGIAVLPFEIDFPSSGAESYERSLGVANYLAATTDKLVYGPGEFTVQSTESDNLRASTDILKRVRFEPDRQPERFLAIRLTTQQRIHMAGEDRKPRVTVTVRAELLSLERAGVLASTEGSIAMDTDSTTQGDDNWPGLTRLTTSLVDDLVTAVGWKRVPPPETEVLRFVTAPAPAVNFMVPGSKRTRPTTMEREAAINRRLEALGPALSEQQRVLFREEPYGLLITGLSGQARQARFQAGDFVLDAGGDPLLGEYVLRRHLHDGPTRLRLKRNGVALETELFP